MNLSEDQIIELIIAGDSTAFEFVFFKYYGSLCAYANNLLFSHYMAEEIVRDTFVKIWEKREKIQIKSSIKYYLFRAVLNRCINYMHHIKIEKKYADSSKPTFSYESEEEDSRNAELVKYILECIEDMPEQNKKVFKLSRFEGLQYQEIADELGLSIKTVEVHISKALKFLREKRKGFKYLMFILFFTAFDKGILFLKCIISKYW